MGALSIRQVKKSYGSHHILKSVDLEIEKGEFIILVGPSGCGKSTLLSMIAGLDSPTSGNILLGDRDITYVAPKDRDIAMVFQSYALYPNMTVAQNIEFALEMRKVPKDERKVLVDKVSKMLQLDHLLDRKPGQLSGGQRQRVAMGRALARQPSLFLFDEPLSNLDAKLRVEMRAEIKLLHQRTKTTTVYVTHDQVEAMTLGDRIAVMRDGILQQFGTPDEIYSRPATKFVAEFIGSPAMNMIKAKRERNTLVANGVDLPLGPQLGAALAAHDGQELVYGLRPEALRFAPAGTGLAGKLTMIEPTGPESYAFVETAAGPLVIRVPGKVDGKVGDTVSLNWQPADVHLFDAKTEQRVNAAQPQLAVA
ncbi:ABC transporter ATP-binding protein [Piscinibacter gummiphilus]|uniref:Sugar ABC transporter ATP-binding protein n=1 Tax=Piscinibacter gummiphilus TaxID=946333 RepID=A0A1W6L4D2_9BURK|nr:ABC transporter ATP-binding protein [Piscinibacter gummiphilus]ARN19181.1 sugar ABC transporter ATP-binding protein [Piscinibacter gummiphilus]ATU63838.1 ABC transporter ATP-binding protein [Piscinibacter gummiphilus]GLS93217.1 sugar ABC transporter ATP-binding protein [Piscinibacter gummiphilus]